MKKIFLVLFSCLLITSLSLNGEEEDLKLLNDIKKAEIEFLKDVVKKINPDGIVSFIKDVVMEKVGVERGELREALMEGEYSYLKEFVRSVDGKGRTALHEAACLGEIEIARVLMDMGIDVNVRDNDGRTALHRMELNPIQLFREINQSKRIEMVKLLIEEGTDINFVDKRGRTVLHEIAALRGSSEIAGILIDGGIDVNARDKEGRTALHILMSKEGEEFERRRDGEGFHAREMKLIELLIGRGADLNLRDNAGRTLLHEAAISGNSEILEVLVGKGLDVNVLDKEGRTALHLAVTVDSDEALKMSEILVGAGARIDIRDKRGWTVLHEAASLYSKQRELMRFFIDKGADVHAKDKDGRTALYEAIRFWRIWGMEVLIQSGADINEQDREGRTPLHEAVKACNDGFEKSVETDGWRYGVDEKDGVIDVVGRKRMWERTYKPCETVKALIEKGADLNLRDYDGKVPLFELDETVKEIFKDEIRSNEIRYEESKTWKGYLMLVANRIVDYYDYVVGG